eukprot:274400_1
MASDAPAKPTNNLSPPTGTKWLYAESGHTEANATTQNATWGGLCVSGHEQSPIDIVTANVKKASTAVITTHLETTASYVKNTGHGFQLFETKPSASVMDDSGTVS